MAEPMWYSAHRDIALAVLGAATGLASVLLVFVGFLLSTAGSFPEGTAKSIVRRYERLAKFGLVPVGFCVIVMLASFSWLFHPESIWLLKLWAIGFPIGGWAFVIYAAVAVLRK